MSSGFVKQMSDMVLTELGHETNEEQTFYIRVKWSFAIDYDSGFEKAAQAQTEAFVASIVKDIKDILAKNSNLTRFLRLDDMSTTIDPATFFPVVSFKAVFV